MEAALASEVRKNWSQFLDTVVREKPQAVQRNRDKALMIAIPHMEEILSHYRFTLEYEIEEDGSYSGWLKEVDVMCNAPSLDELKQVLAQDLIEYAHEYMEVFNRYFNSPNRRSHLPYILHVLIKDSVQEVIALIDAKMEGA